jgi:dTDP-4-dehydrorhamnose 3,5-epimerase
MILEPTPIAGAFLVDLERREDERGWFARAFCRNELDLHGVTFDVKQANLARTHRAGVVRGLHYRRPPDAEAKFVHCVRGALFDAIVDARPGSRTYRNVFHTRLDSDNHRALLVPGGVAHGYQALVDGTEMFYLTDQFYVPGVEEGLRFDDPALAIPWPLPPRDVTERDQTWPLLP